MAAPSIPEMLKYANLQMASEALYDFRAKLTPDQTPGDLHSETGHYLDQAPTVDILTTGNEHASRFTPTEAAKFAGDWIVVDHLSNTSTGFSGTLFRAVRDNPAQGIKAGELVLSLRSTEFIDDARRDSVATNSLEIKAFGWAFGQISDLEAWYGELTRSGKLPVGAHYSVTGYSLGGHLATAFHLLRREDGSAGQVDRVVTFNGAGVGKITSGTLGQLIDDFRALRDHPETIAARFADTGLGELYGTLRDRLADGHSPTADDFALLGSLSPPTDRPRFEIERGFLREALLRLEALHKAATHLGAVTDTKDGQPAAIPDRFVAQARFEYQMALLWAQELKTTAKALVPNALNIVLGKSYEEPRLDNQFDIVGRETTNTRTAMVANSQWHHGTNVDLFIEDQPLLRGTILKESAAALWDTGALLPVNEYGQNDFGDTHSLVLLVDSLHVQHLLQTLAPTATPAEIETLFRAASAVRAKWETGTQGQAEGDVLENLLNGLAQQLLGQDIPPLEGRLAGNTWADPDDRRVFYERIQTLTQSPGFETLAGKVTPILPSRDLATAARTDFAAFLALHTLSPFALKTLPGHESDVETVLKENWNTQYTAWQADQKLTPEQREKDEATYSDHYLADRAAFLARLAEARLANTGEDKALWVSTFNGSRRSYQDEASGLSLKETPSLTDAPPEARVVFGGKGNDSVSGGSDDDAFYGGDGSDRLDGGGGSDRLEGQDGSDILAGGDGKDTLLGGQGNDILEGGEGNDLLDGGDGDDTYVLTPGSDFDRIRDRDGLGHLRLGEQTLDGADWVADGFWQKDGVSYRFTAGPDGRGQLVIVSAAGITTVDNYRLGELGLNLGGPPSSEATPSPPTTRDIVGDFEPLDVSDSPGVQTRRDDIGNLVQDLSQPNPTLADDLDDSSGPDHIQTGGGSDYVFAARGGDDWIESGPGNDRVRDLKGSDRLQGGEGDDVLEAGPGPDRVEGGDGHDLLFGGDDDDRLYAQTRLDLADAFAQNDRQEASDAPGVRGDLIAGDEGDDRLIGDTGNDLLFGGGGDDTLLGGGGDDTLFGYSNILYVTRDWQAERRVEERAGVTVYDVEFSELILYAGEEGTDLLFGGAGDDWLFAEGGADLLDGGEGDDVAFGNAGNDDVHGGAGDDVLSGDNLDAPDLSSGSLSGSLHGRDVLHGGDGDDRLFGNGNADWLDGGDGDDWISGDDGKTPGQYHGQDIVDGGDGNDKLWGGGDNDELYGGAGDDRIVGDGNDTSGEYHGQDILVGGDGNDELWGGGKDDELVGGDGDDYLEGDDEALDATYHGQDNLSGGAGTDSLSGGGGDDQLDGGSGKDALSGGSGDDLLDGGEGDDSLSGGDGDDTLIGGSGTDYLDGGAGDDRYFFANGDSPLNALGQSETVDDPAGRNTVVFGGATLDRINLRVGDDSSYLVIDAGGGDQILVEGGVDGTVATYEFADGERLDYRELLGRRAAGSWYRSGAGDASAIGGLGDDTLEAPDGGTVVSGGRGDDRVVSSGGGNTFLYSLGDGFDLIIETSKASGFLAANTLRFGAGIRPADIVLRLGSLILQVGDDPASGVHLAGVDPEYLLDQPPIDRFEFADGTVLTYEQLLARGFDLAGSDGDDAVRGTSVDDRISGGPGNDELIGGTGSDTYRYQPGDGIDRIREGLAADGEHDVLQLGAGLVAGGFDITRDYHDLRLSFADGGEVLLPGQLDGGGQGIEQLAFADGTVWSADELAAAASFVEPEPRLFFGTDGSDDPLTDGDGPDTVWGLFGNDRIVADRGSDQLFGAYDYDAPWAGDELYGEDAGRLFADDDEIFGGAGDDWIDGGFRADRDHFHGGDGNDTYVFRRGSGNDTVHEYNEIGNSDRIWLESLRPEQVRFRRQGDDLRLEIVDADDTLTVANFFVDDTAVIERFIFTENYAIVAEWTVDDVRRSALIGGAGDDVLSGTAADDTLAGRGGDDALDGGDGSDTYEFARGDGRDTLFDSGASGIDRIRLGAGIAPSDLAVTRTENDLLLILRDSGERLTITGWYGADGPTIEAVDFADGTTWNAADLESLAATPAAAGEGADFLAGTAAGEALSGLGGNDELYGLAGDDTLDGGAGDDLLAGGSGDDSYRYAPGGGADRIDDAGADDHDVLELAAGIRPDDVRVTRNASDLFLFLPDGGRLTVAGAYRSEANRLAAVRFADGGEWLADDLARLAAQPSDSADYLVGSEADDVLHALAGDDELQAGDGNDELAGGPGNDALDGGAGDDVYLFQAGDGADRISDAAGTDTLRFGAGMRPEDWQIFADESTGEILLQRHGSGDRLHIPASFREPWGGAVVKPVLEHVEFADGTVWSGRDFATYAMPLPGSGPDHLVGSPRAEILDGLGGDDEAAGGAGDDRYVFRPGYGTLTIRDEDSRAGNVDTVLFGEGLSPADVIVRAESPDLIVEFGGGTDRLRVRGFFDHSPDGEKYRVERFEFADGTVWGAEDVEARLRVSPGTNAGEIIIGSGRADEIFGLAGPDELYGGDGDDRLDGGTGSDRLFGGGGDDTLSSGESDAADRDSEWRFDQGWDFVGYSFDRMAGGAGNDSYLIDAGSGYDLIDDSEGSNRIVLGEGLSAENVIVSAGTFPGHVGQTRIDFGPGAVYLDPGTRIDRIESADGVVVTADDLPAYFKSFIAGSAVADDISGTRGPDEIRGEAGNDRIHGGGGRDSLEGGEGLDLIFGDSGDDTLRDAIGDNLLFGGDGNDSIVGRGYLSGGRGDDRLEGDGILDGGAGDDAYQVQESGAIVFGPGSGRDVVLNGHNTLANYTVNVRAQAADVELIGGELDGIAHPLVLRIPASGDELSGIGGAAGIVFSDGTIWSRAEILAHARLPEQFVSAGNDVLLGSEAADVLAAQAGDDRLAGGPGDDVLDGGDGNDILRAGSGDDLLDGGEGSDQLAGGDGDDTIHGGAGGDTLDGEAGHDRLFGGAGNDTLRAGAGDDLLDGGADNDLYQVAGGTNTIRFGRGSAVDQVTWLPGAATPARLLIELSGDLRPDEVLLESDSGNLRVSIRDTSDALIVDSWFRSGPLGRQLELHFADGSVWTNAEVLAKAVPRNPAVGDFRDDVLTGEAGNDQLSGLGGDDTLDGRQGDDALDGGEGEDGLLGGPGNDSLSGGIGDDDLRGGDGNDSLAGGPGSDVLDGGAGNDRLDAGEGSSGGTPDRSADSVVFGYGSGADLLIGGDERDVIQLSAGVHAGDLRIAVEASDLLIRLNGSDDSLRLRGWASSSRRPTIVRLSDGSQLDLGEPPAGVTIGGEGADVISESEASPFDDRLYGQGGDDTLHGGMGDDVLIGGAGSDFLAGGAGADLLDGGQGNDSYHFADDNDTLVFGFASGSDSFYENADDSGMLHRAPATVRFADDVTPDDVEIVIDSLSARHGRMSIRLEGSTARLDGFLIRVDPESGPRVASRFVFGDGTTIGGGDVFEQWLRTRPSDGNDALIGRAAAETIDAGRGDDAVHAGAGDDRLSGGGGNDVLDGGSGNDRVEGNSGNDQLAGGSGDDVLDGGSGNDALRGDAGADLYRFDEGFGSDRILGLGESTVDDAIEFGPGIRPEEITIRLSPASRSSLLLGTTLPGSEIWLENGWLPGNGEVGSRLALKEIRFADGTRWTSADVAARLQPASESDDRLSGSDAGDHLSGLGGNDSLFGAEGDDALSGGNGNDRLEGGAGLDILSGDDGDDTLAGGSGSDRLFGGAGNDLLVGGAGGDVYRFERGGGQDLLADFGADIKEVDTLHFGAGIALADVAHRVVDGQLVLDIAGGEDRVTIVAYDQPGFGIDRLRFADGTVIDPLTWSERKRDVALNAGAGEQVLARGARLDTLLLGTGLSPSSMALRREGADLVVAGAAESMRLSGWFDDPATQPVLQMRFADGALWDAAEMSRRASTQAGTAADDRLSPAALVRAFPLRLDGGEGDDRITGGDADDELIGGRGDDRLAGGFGADVLIGGDGDDVYEVDDADTVIELADGGSDTIRMAVTEDVVLAGEIENFEAGGSAPIALTGNARANRLVGTSGINRLDGGDGDDLLDGGGAADTLIGGRGNDIFVVDDAADTIVERAGEGVDTVRSSLSYALAADSQLENVELLGTANLNAAGDGGDNALIGNAGSNLLRGFAGDDTLDGGAAADVLQGGAGDDLYRVDEAADRIDESAGEGHDRVLASASFELPAEVEDLALVGEPDLDASGNAGNNALTGNAGANTLRGGEGDDVLDGQGGNDVLIGGAGADTYRFGRGHGHDRISDGDSSSAADALEFAAGIAPTDLLLRRTGDDLVLSLRDSPDRLTVQGYWTAAGALATVRFADRTQWDESEVTARAMASVNTLPLVVAAPGHQVADVGGRFVLGTAAVFADADAGDRLLPTATQLDGEPLPTWLRFDAASWTFSGQPRDGDVGTLAIRLTASDSANASVSTSFELTVRNPNDTSPVVAEALADLTVSQGERLALAVPATTFGDADVGDHLSLSASLANGDALPRWLVFNPATASFSGVAGRNDVGVWSIAVAARDRHGRVATDVFDLTVADTNDAPRVHRLVSDVVLWQGQPIDLALPADLFVDAEGDAFSTAVRLADGRPLPDWLEWDATARRIVGHTPAASVGVTTVRISATDVHGAVSKQDFDIVVGNVNDAPVATHSLPLTTLEEGDLARIALPADLFVDPDKGDDLTYSMSVVSRPEHATSSFRLVESGGAWTLESIVNTNAPGTRFAYSGLTPGDASKQGGLDYWDIGAWTFRLTATDRLGLQASTEVSLVVDPSGVNHLPVLGSLPQTDGGQVWRGLWQWSHAGLDTLVVSMAEDFGVKLPDFHDVDGDELSISVVAANPEDRPQWRYDAATNSLRYVGTGAPPRRAAFHVIADDGRGGSSFVVEEVIANRPPELGYPAIVVREDQETTIRLPGDAVSDPDGDAVQLSDAELRSYNPLTGNDDVWATFDSATRQIRLRPGNFSVGTHDLPIHAYDSFRNIHAKEPDGESGSWVSDMQTLRITVVNEYDAPILRVPLADLTVEEDRALSLATANAFLALDPGQTLAYAATLANGSPLPSWLAFDSTSGALSGTPGADEIGNYTIRVVASDGLGGTAVDEFALSVTLAPGNHAPRLANPVVDQVYRQKQEFSFPLPRDTFVDTDGDALTYSASLENGSPLPAWIQFDAATLTFSGEVPEGQRAPTEIRLTATDGHGASAIDTFSLGIDEASAPPLLVTAAADQVAVEDSAFVYVLPENEFRDDTPSGPLALTATLANGEGLPDWLHFDPAARRFSGTPDNSDIGSLEIRVSATEPDGGAAADVFAIAVVNSNDAPVVDSAPEVPPASEDSLFDFTLPANVFRDVDPGDALTLSARQEDGDALPPWLAFDSRSGRFSGTPANGDVGNWRLRLTATDLAGAAATTSMTLNVANVNDAPEVGVTLAGQRATQGEAFALTLPPDTFSDVDAGDALTFAATLEDGGSLPAWLSFDATTRTFSGTPANRNVGELWLRVAATDLAGASASQVFALSIADINDAPQLRLAPADQTASEDAAFTYTLPDGMFADIDAGDALSLSATLADGSALPDWLRFDAARGVFSGTPQNGDVGSLALRVRATDRAGAAVAADFALAVDNVNDAPTAAMAIADQRATQGQAFALTLPSGTFSDVDAGDVLSLAATLDDGRSLPAWLSFDATTGTFSGTPANRDVGDWRLRVAATDLAGASASQVFALSIADINDAPQLRLAPADQTASEDAAFTYTLPDGMFADIDAGDALSLSATLADGSALPDWLRFDAARGVFSGTPQNGDVGSLALRVRATDRAGAAVAADFALAVDNVNDAPTAAMAIADQRATQGQAFALTLPSGTFSDVDAGDVLSLAATLDDGRSLPAWLSFDATTGTFSGTPANRDVGDWRLRVTATDLAGASASQAFALSIADVNDAPQRLLAPADQTAFEDSAFTYALPDGMFADIDAGDALSLSATLADGSALPDWLRFDAARGVFSGTPQNGDVGSLALRVRATDRAGAAVAADFALAVNNVNDAPLASAPLASQSARSGSAFRYELPAGAFIDVDAGDRLLLSASLGGGGALPSWLRFDASTATFSGTPSGGAASYDISVTASDLAGATSSQRFALSVSGGNAIPVANPDTAAVSEDLRPSASGNVLANDRDDDGRTPLRVGDAGTRRGTYGLLMLLANGGYRYLLDNRSSQVQSLGAGERGVDRFSYQSSDGQDFALGELSVTVSGTNDVPWLQNPLPDLSLARNSRVYWQIPADSFADRDANDTLTFSARQVDGSALPSWLRFDAATRTFSGYVPAHAQGELAIVVTASDGHGAGSSAADTFNIGFANARGHGGGGSGNAPAMPRPGHDHHDEAGNSSSHPDSRHDGRGDDRQNDWERAWGVGAWAGDDRGQRRGLAYLDRDSLRSFVDSSRAGGDDDRQPSGSRVPDDFFQRWTAMDRTLNRLLQESDRAGSWSDAGHAGEAYRFAGLAQGGANPMRGGVDPVSLPGSGEPFLRSFRGLQEGVDRII